LASGFGCGTMAWGHSCPILSSAQKTASSFSKRDHNNQSSIKYLENLRLCLRTEREKGMAGSAFTAFPCWDVAFAHRITSDRSGRAWVR
jgi:hypothetical protein